MLNTLNLSSLFLAGTLLFMPPAFAVEPVLGGHTPPTEMVVCDTEAQVIEIADAWIEGGQGAGRAVYQQLNAEVSIHGGEPSCIIAKMDSPTVVTIHPIIGEITFGGRPLQAFSVELQANFNPAFRFWMFWLHDPKPGPSA